jgi:hypothetical protein
MRRKWEVHESQGYEKRVSEIRKELHERALELVRLRSHLFAWEALLHEADLIASMFSRGEGKDASSSQPVERSRRDRS